MKGKTDEMAFTPDDGLFLPDFCNIRTLFLVILMGELLAILLTLAGNTDISTSYSYLGLISLFILWIVLVSAALLCWGRRWLRRLSQIQAGFAAFAIILLITALFSYLVLYLLQNDADTRDFDSLHQGGFIIGNLVIAGMISAIALRYFYIQYNWRCQIRAEAEARIQALQSRIRPHFLFNSMNIIASLTRSNPALAERTVEDLSDLFRANLSGNQNHTTWEGELKLSQQYLAIEQLRLGNRLSVDWQIDAMPGDALLPSLTLQPLLENAIYHGIEPLPEGGTVQIRANRAGNRLSLLIENPVPQSMGRKQQGNQIAQDNVRQRLALFFQGMATLHAKTVGKHYSVTLTFPYRTHL